MEVGVPGPFPAAPAHSGLMNCGGSNHQQMDTELDMVMAPPPPPPPPSIGAGLENLGNTCFLNAVTQCLIHTVPLVQALRSLDHRNRCSCDEEEFCSLCAFQLLMEQCFQSSAAVVEPDMLVNNLNYVSPSFRRFQQEDAHEFLICLLDSLENSYDKRGPKDRPNSKDGNFVQNIFGGRLQSQVKCCNCGHISGMFDPMIDLNLEIDDSDTLTGALESFTNVEKMDDPENKFTCEGCREQVFVEKQLKLDRLPPVIMLHLKRFKITGHFSNKIDKHVDYPRELDLSPYAGTSSNEQTLKYDLYGVLVHDGWSAYSGHYYCVIRSSSTTWHVMDDSEVHDISEEQALSRQAYILFYVRQEYSPWFSSYVKEEFGDDFHNVITKQTSPSSVLDPLGSIWASSPEREQGRQNRDTLSHEVVDKADSRKESRLDVTRTASGNKMETDLCRSSSPISEDVCEPGVSGSSLSCLGEASKCGRPLTERSKSSIEGRTKESSYPLKTPPRLARDDDLKKVFFDEQFDDDDKENYVLFRPGSAQTAPVAQSPSQIKQSGGGAPNRMQEVLNSRLNNMPSGKRRAFEACLSPSHRSGGPENPHKKKHRLHLHRTV